jgi:hypothetical protein
MQRFIILLLLIPFLTSFSGRLFSQFKKPVALSLAIAHSDTNVTAIVKANGKNAIYDSIDKRYLVLSNVVNRNKNVLTIEKAGFTTEKINIDSIFKDNQRKTDVPVGIRLKHKWDNVFLENGLPIAGTVNPGQLIIMNVGDTAKVFRTIRGHNLYITNAFDNCNPSALNRYDYTNVNSYLLTHCYGAWVKRNNSEHLKYLRERLGRENAGPVILVGGSYKMLSHRLEVSFTQGITENRRNEILKMFRLTIYHTYEVDAEKLKVEAETGTGDYILGIAHSLQELKEVAYVSNILVEGDCKGN